MPHSTTKSHRPKRPDVRPNAKSRNKTRLAAVEKMEAKDLIRTRIPKAQHKERGVTGILRAPRKPTSTSTIEKKIRSLQKLRRQIELLSEKRIAGEVLDVAQLEKLARRDSVIGEIEEIEELLEDDDSDEGEEDEDVDVSSQASEEDEQVDATDMNVKRAIKSKEDHKKKKKIKTSEQ